MKRVAWVLLGIVIGAVGYYFATKEPNDVRPDNPVVLSIMLKQAVDANDLNAVQSLFTPQQKDSFTSSDLQSLRRYIQAGTEAEGGASLDTFLVMTLGNHRAITLWLAPPVGTNHTWQIMRITKGAQVEDASHLP